MPLVFHWGGPAMGTRRVPAELIASSLLVHDGPQWIGVYEPVHPPQVRDIPQGTDEVAGEPGNESGRPPDGKAA